MELDFSNDVVSECTGKENNVLIAFNHQLRIKDNEAISFDSIRKVRVHSSQMFLIAALALVSELMENLCLGLTSHYVLVLAFCFVSIVIINALKAY